MPRTPSRVLILYGTTEGHTARVAAAMAETARSCGVDAAVANATAAPLTSPDDFTEVIIAASVHAGGYQGAVTRWVRAHAAALGTHSTAFVSVCLGVLEHKPEVDRQLAAAMERWFERVGWRPVEIKVVAGALPYTKYPWWTRWIMRRIVARANGDTDTTRDYVYTDWADLAVFTREFLTRAGMIRERPAPSRDEAARVSAA